MPTKATDLEIIVSTAVEYEKDVCDVLDIRKYTA
jgi:hypothetical protein